MSEEHSNVPAAAEDADPLANALEESLRKDRARRFRKGDRVSGRVYKIGENMAFVDIEGRGEGMLDLADLRRPDGTLEVEEGSEIEALVVDAAANGVFLKKALMPAKESVEQLMAASQAGLPVQAKVTGVNKGGLELDLFGLRAFCPSSQIELHKPENLAPYVGETYTFRIMEVKEDGSKIVLSRRALLKEEEDARLAEVKAKIVPGAVLQGRVTRLQPFGAFVDLGGIEGLVHLTELSRGRAQHPSDVVQAGEEIEVQVLKVEETADKSGRKTERISLSRKALEKDPWEEAAERFPVGTKVKGKVVRLQPFGAFIEVASGLDGMAHISELADRRIEHPRDAVKEGDEVEATVLAIEPEKKRLSLSLREKRPQPKGERAPKAAKGPQAARPPRRDRGEGRDRKGPRPDAQVVEVTVEKVEHNGLTVALPDGGKATISNMDLSAPKNADYRKLFPPGTTLKAAVVGKDPRTGIARASVKEAERQEERAAVRDWNAQQKAEQKGRFGNSFADLLKKANLIE